MIPGVGDINFLLAGKKMPAKKYQPKRPGTAAKGLEYNPMKIPPLAAEMKTAPVPNLQIPPGVNILGIPIPVFGKMPPGKVAVMPPKLVKKAPPLQPMPKMQPKNLFGGSMQGHTLMAIDFPRNEWTLNDIGLYLFLKGLQAEDINNDNANNIRVSFKNADDMVDYDLDSAVERVKDFLMHGQHKTLIQIYVPNRGQTGGAAKFNKVYDFNPKTGKDYYWDGGAVSASDITGWIGKIGGVISDIFVPGSSVALEAAMDNVGSSIDAYIAEKKAAAATKAWLKLKKDVQSNSAFTDWQKNQILNLMNQIQLANNAKNTDKVKELQSRIDKLKQGDYHTSDQYKQFVQLIEATGLDAQSKSILLTWLEEAKNPANDLTNAQRQAKWDSIRRELTKAQQATQTGQRPMLGTPPTQEQIATHMKKLEKQAGLSGGKVSGSQVHSVVFPQNEWTLEQAVDWLHQHRYKAPKVDFEANTMRFRQIPPWKFKRFATKTVDSDGKKINLVIGFHTSRKPKNIKPMISE